MNWTKDAPTKQGHYWHKLSEAVEVVDPRTGEQVSAGGAYLVKVRNNDGFLEVNCQPVSQMGGEWQGPLTPDDGQRMKCSDPVNLELIRSMIADMPTAGALRGAACWLIAELDRLLSSNAEPFKVS